MILENKGFTYLTGAKTIVALAFDTQDIVAGREEVTVDVIKGKQTFKFKPRGFDDDMPYNIMKRLLCNVTAAANIEFKTLVGFGEGIKVYKRYREEQTKEIKITEVLPEEYPEVFEFLENNSIDKFAIEIMNDLRIFYDGFVEYIFNREEKPKIVQIRVLENAYSRISTVDEKNRKSLWHGYCSGWYKRDWDDLTITPLLDRNYPVTDLKQRKGIMPQDDGKYRDSGETRFVQMLTIPTPGHSYYAFPYWWSVFLSGWYDFSNAVITFKKEILQNELAVKYVVYIQEGFWNNLYEKTGATDDKTRKKAREDFLSTLEEFLSGAKNAGKTFVTDFKYAPMNAQEMKDILITKVDAGNKGGDYIEDSEESSNVMCYAMGVHSSILGNSPGKSKNINGTEARELFTIQQALAKLFQRMAVQPLEIVKAINNWPKELVFGFENLRLTTLDKNTGAVKDIGIAPPDKQ